MEVKIYSMLDSVNSSLTIATDVMLILMMALLIGLIAFLIQTFQNRKREFYREILKIKLEVQENTLQHISRELHDNIGQYLTLAKLQMNTIDLPPGSIEGENIKSSVELLTRALHDMRNLSNSLSLDLIRNVGLDKAIATQVEQVKKVMGDEIVFEVVGNYNFLDERREIVIFRIFQEAINNVVKHSRATRVKVELSCQSSGIKLTVEDNGRGFEESDSRSGGSGGVSNMRARAVLINADFCIRSAINEGTKVEVILPLEGKNRKEKYNAH